MKFVFCSRFLKICSALSLLILNFSDAYSQNVSVARIPAAIYDSLKTMGSLPKGPFMITGKNQNRIQPMVRSSSTPVSSVICNCIIPIDSSFLVAPFAFAPPPDYRNDDASTSAIDIPFNFCFYGQPQDSFYINNNGNISFGSPYGTYTANGFPDPNFVMIAPFWGDVDTQGPLSGLVYYKITPTYIIVRWQQVGYFSAYDDLLNDFQLIITDGNDPILPPGNNVSFCYGDMQWTTGDASGGSGGFGGSAATVGVNQGNGVDYIQIGTFDAPGTNYDGPFGQPDQVSWLDNQSFYFNVCNNGAGNNLPPIINSAEICDTLVLCVGDTATIGASFLSPEQAQNTTATMTSTSSGFSVLSNVPGNPAVISGQLIASPSNIGFNTITVTGTDNGTPSATTTSNVIISVVNTPTVNFTANPPAPVQGPVTVQFTDNTSGAISWLWDFGDGQTSTQQNPTHTYVTDSLYVVTLTITLPGGCTGTRSLSYLVQTDPIVLSIISPNIITPNGDGNNDALIFTNLDGYPQTNLYVYNRWGNLVYSSENYLNDWVPDVSDGVYYYVLSGSSLESSIAGFFHVAR